MNTPVDQAIVEMDRVPQGSIRPPSATPPVISIVGKSGTGMALVTDCPQEGFPVPQIALDDALGLCGIIIDHVDGLR